jgi:hypothetical protein
MARARRRNTKKKIPEVDLGKALIAYLESSGWDVYQEVTFKNYIADIVVVNGPVVGVIEMKTSLSMTLLGQARRWLPYANLVWVAVPKTADYAYDGANWVCKSTGLGLFGVRRPSARNGYEAGVKEDVMPNFHRKVFTKELRAVLRPEHKTYAAAGSASGKVWTPFRATSQDLRNLVQAEPGIALKDALKRVRHHYSKDSTARACMTKNIEKGFVEGVELRREGRAIKLFPT